MNNKQEEDIKKIKEELEKEEIKNIYLTFVDFTGNILFKSVGVKELIRNTHVSWFDGISINGNLISEFENIKNSEWMVLLPDSNSFYKIPFIKEKNQKSAIILCDIKKHPYDTRKLLKNVVDEYLKIGITAIVGPELIYSMGFDENQNKFIDKENYYSSLPVSKRTQFNNNLVNNILESNIDIEYYMPYGKNHNRIDLVPDVANISADKLFICKWFAENLAYLENTSIDFSNIEENEISSCPMHFSLWKGNREQNLFFDEKDEFELSVLGKKFINGIIYHNKFIKAVIKSCTNYPLKEHITKYSTIRDNSLISVPLYFKEKQKKDRVGWSKRCIYNGINADCNYYLVIACILYAGLFGITTEKNIEKLAKSDNYSKKELIEEVKSNKYFRGLLNEELINKIIQKLEDSSEI